MDLVLDKLSSLSTQTIQSMDNNIALMNNIINLHENLGKSANDPHKVQHVMDQTTFYCEQMHLMNLRTKYFEAQLNILQAHSTFNSLLQESDHSGMNWRTTEATLENLYLEYHYHTIKFQELLKNSKDIETEFISRVPSRANLKKKESKALLLKPLKTSAKRQSRLIDSPLSAGPLLASPVNAATSTPNNSNSSNIASDLTGSSERSSRPQLNNNSHNFNDSSMTLLDVVEDDKHLTSTKRNLKDILECEPIVHTTNNYTHRRSLSIPVTPISQIYGTFEDHETKNVRHFISHDTGLNHYKHGDFSVSFDSIIKESEMVGSFSSSDDEYGEDGVEASDQTIRDINIDFDIDFDDNQSTTSPNFAGTEDDDDDIDEPTFDFQDFIEDCRLGTPALKRSTSHDSIFNTKTPSSSSWMRKLSHKIEPTTQTFNITAGTFNARQVLHPEVSKIDSHFELFKNIELKSTDAQNAKTSKQLLSAVVTNSYMKKLDLIPIPKKSALSTDKTDSASSHWLQFLSKITPNGSVTSEIGKPVLIPSLAKTYTRNVNQNDHHNGSYSTLTIGPNLSRTINYRGATDQPANVLSTRVSHTALNEALSEPLFY